jgi:hypothetical protein
MKRCGRCSSADHDLPITGWPRPVEGAAQVGTNRSHNGDGGDCMSAAMPVFDCGNARLVLDQLVKITRIGFSSRFKLPQCRQQFDKTLRRKKFITGTLASKRVTILFR